MMNRPRGKWWAWTQVGLLFGAFIWLRWYSRLWQNRWTGFCFGAVFVLWTSFPWRNTVRQQLELARSFDHPKRVAIFGLIGAIGMGATAVKRFWEGRPFLFSSGVRAAGDDGFFVMMLLVWALQWLYATWFLLRNFSDQSSQTLVAPSNHG